MSGLKPFVRTRSNVLWTVFNHKGVPLALQAPQQMSFPVFSTERAAGEWVMALGLEQHIVSRPLAGQLLVDLLMLMKRGGFTSVALDPPKRQDVGFPAAPIDYFLEQARAKVSA